MDPLAHYLSEVTSPACIEFCARQTGLPVAGVRQRLRDYAGEVRVGAELVAPLALTGRRVLEVGAGLGLLGIWLRRQGVTIVMLEPGAGGFSENERLFGALLEWLHVPPVDIINEPAQALDPQRHGWFDVIFSVNVLEHIPALEDALHAMISVLAPGGLMRHTCPNYNVPYEPHYGWPLIPVVPAATARLIPRVQLDEVWQSLNFVTSGRVKRFCRSGHLRCVFDRGTLARAFERIDRDPAFRLRRGPLVATTYTVLRAIKLLNILRHLPPVLATPMVFTCWRDQEQPSAWSR